MAGSAPNHGGWKAVENRQPPGVRLKVTGEVETTNGGLKPRLRKIEPQGTNPTILMLELWIENTGTGTTDVKLRPVEYQEDISAGQYRVVEIHWERQVLRVIDNIEILH